MADRKERGRSIYEHVSALEKPKRKAVRKSIGRGGVLDLATRWVWRARPEQLPPPGDWTVWLMLAGRGFGKTRAGAEWVRALAEADATARIALIGASLHEARAVMVEGESGLLAIAPSDNRPDWQPSRRRLLWPNGAEATIFGAADPDMLRGPQHSHAWADEIAKWPCGVETWDNAMMGLRLGERPRMLATTTPRPVALVRRLVTGEGVVVTRGRTMDNRTALPPRFLAAMKRDYEGTRLGRQELDGELLEDPEGALWTRDLLDDCRVGVAGEDAQDRLERVVIGVDPPAGSRGDACGIIVAGRDQDGMALVVEDASVERSRPEQWARRVARAAARWRADRVVAEANNGGAMVESVLRAANIGLPVRLVHATRGKVARAEPVAALYEAGRARHAGMFARLEDELCGLLIGGGYEGPGRSPDRADALVWALTDLMLAPGGRPRVRGV